MIFIPQNIIDGIIAQAKNELPDEACGLLIGKENTVVKQYPLTNVDHSPEHFSFDPKEQFGVLREARSQGLQIIANYHSHPASPARPSEEDIRLAFDPDITYIILSLQEKENLVIKAFSITPQPPKGGFGEQRVSKEVKIKITK
ncbi:MAG: M67 family metallopeptidase [Candidatus Symbiothrix sp.]|jgi:proteasome lid subunit RPN8/RPN11|nr:M67 family metallopeptidase [Candidatus Symbiothrix sp.]